MSIKNMGTPGGKKGALGGKQKVGPFNAVGYVNHPKGKLDQGALPLVKILRKAFGK